MVVFAALLWRDLYVDLRKLPGLVAELFLQPFLLLLVFGLILPSIGFASKDYPTVLLPGLIALTAVSTPLQSLCVPLLVDIHYTREIEDRLLAPLPTRGVGLGKLVLATVRGITAAAVLVPVGWLVLGRSAMQITHPAAFATSVVLGAVVGAGLGLTLAGIIPVQRIDSFFAFVYSVLIFTGCAQYPWHRLDGVGPMQWIVLANPLTFVSEALRNATASSGQFLDLWICWGVLLLFAAVLVPLGLRGFLRLVRS